RTTKKEPRLVTQEAIIILSLWADGWFSSWKNSISTCNNDIANIDGCSKAPKILSQVPSFEFIIRGSDKVASSTGHTLMSPVHVY
ncbi:hypothetical protein Tco_1481407, partial [Tanacetum coccineum]